MAVLLPYLRERAKSGRPPSAVAINRGRSGARAQPFKTAWLSLHVRELAHPDREHLEPLGVLTADVVAQRLHGDKRDAESQHVHRQRERECGHQEVDRFHGITSFLGVSSPFMVMR